MRAGAGLSLSLALSLGLWVAQPALAAKAVPTAPYYYVLDEGNVLDPHSLQALQALLIEHDRTTGEQILVALFKSLDDEDIVAYTTRVFQEWKIGQRGKDNGALLALYWQDRKARIEVGYGLEGLLTDAKAKRILEDSLFPELKAGNPNRALSLAALEILRTIESPLVTNGRADEILRAGGIHGSLKPAPKAHMRGRWSAWVGLGLVILTIVINLLTSAEAHFTRQGWYRPRPWNRKRWRSSGAWPFLGGGDGGWGSGGGSGWGGGGGGGYSGGGGRSGGGGASGSW